MARGGGRSLIFLVYVILGLYFLNAGFHFIKNLPDFFLKIDRWIFIIGGGLLIFESLKYLRSRRVITR